MGENDWESLQLKVAMAAGALLIDGVASELEIHDPHFSRESLDELADSVLQAARVKMTKPEFISCPGCGRTLYDLESTFAEVKRRTAHLAGVKIAVMGCVVNGPGEMADADYGYVGEGRGHVTLYRGKTPVLRYIPQEEAIDKLLELIASDR